jgi:2-phospho-L-lactate guanylyltransferase
VLAIVPVSAPGDAKRRLAPFLGEEQRRGLVIAMLEDVLEACRRARSVERTLVVTPDPSLVPADVELVADLGRGHAAAIELALGQAPADGALIVMADCPLVRPETLDRLAAAARPVAIGLAQDGGTNALALRPADAVTPAFGIPNGAALIVRRARAAGLEPAVIDDAGLAFDVDTLDDLERVRDLGNGTRTHRFLLASELLSDRLT